MASSEIQQPTTAAVQSADKAHVPRGQQELSATQDEAAGADGGESDAELQAFELSLYLPARPLLPANSVSTGLPETPSPLKVAVNPQESLNELRITITDSPEGYWLGAFCFRRAPSTQGKQQNGHGEAQQRLGERVEEWTELREIFKDVPIDQRELYIAHVAFSEAEARAHVQRLRELLSGGQADPMSIGIDGGLSVHDAVKNENLWLEELKNESAAIGQAHATAPLSSKKNKANGNKKHLQQSLDHESDEELQKKDPFANLASWKVNDVSELVPKQARPQRAFPICLRHFALAAWSPPPHHLRAKGHHFYLHITTLEGDNLFITASTQGFYIKKSTVHRFDATPRAGSDAFASCSLFDVLCAASPLFMTTFAKLFQDPVSQRDYFAVVPISNCIQAYPWLARQHTHSADPLRTQSAFLLTGATSADTLDGTRDWNDEIQSTRELPRSTLQERLMRDRVLNRAHAEFNLAAARAVPRVAAGEVQAMNPMDRRDAQMFIINNLFISKGVDGVDLYPHMGGDEAAHVAVSKDVQGIRCLNTLDIEGICLLGTVVIDWLGERWVAQSVVPGLFRRRDDEVDEDGNPVVNATGEDGSAAKDDTQVIYGGVEGPEVIRDDFTFHALFSRVAKSLRLALHEVPDAKGLQHPLWLSVDSKGLRGADGRKYALDLARLNPVDINWLEKDVSGQLIDGDEGTSVDGDETAETMYPHRMTLLRQELLEIYWDSELRNWAQQELANKGAAAEKDKKSIDAGDKKDSPAEEKSDEKPKKEEGEGAATEAKEEPERLDASQFKLAFNPDAFVEFKPADATKDVDASAEDAPRTQTSKPVVLINDESDPSVAAVRKAGTFLRERALPRLVTDVAIGTHTTQDGQSLTRQLHARGINMRYLGQLAHLTMPSQRHLLTQELIERAGPGIEGFLAPFRRVVVQEMVVRAAKRILRGLVRQAEAGIVGNVVAHFLNCLLGERVQSAPAAIYTPSPFDGEDADALPAWVALTPASLRASIEHEVRTRFRFRLPRTYFRQQLQHNQVLREICLRCGIQLKLRKYEMDAAQRDAVAQDGNVSAGDESQGESVQTKSGGGAPQSSLPHASSGGKNKKKKGGAASKAATTSGDHVNAGGVKQTTSFVPDDVLNLVPIIKDSTPRSSLADEAFEAGRVSMGRGDRALGMDLMMEGVSFHEQVYGLVHPETGRCYSTFATVLHHYATVLAVEHAEKQREAGEGAEEVPPPELHEQLSVANALRYQRQAVTVSERTLGLDHPETLAQYVNLAVLERLEGNVEASLRCQQRLLQLLNLVHGADHPEVINALNNVALTLQNAREFERSLQVYQASYDMAMRLYGKDSINTAYLAHELSQAYTLAGDLKKAIEIEKEANKTFEARLGVDDNMTKESTTLLNNLAASAVRVAKMDARQKELTRLGLASQAGRGQVTASAGQLTGNNVNVRSSATSATAAASTVDPSRAKKALPDLSNKSLDELVKFIQGGSASSASQSNGTSSNGKKSGGKGGMKKLGRK